MKTELRLRAHSLIPGAAVVEIWHDGQFIGQVTGAEGPGIRVISKHAMVIVNRDPAPGNGANSIEITLVPMP